MNPDSGASKLDTGEVGPPSGGNNAVEAVFSNPVIWKTIGSYLNMVDLLTCRLVNSGFNAMVMKETNFLNGCLVSLESHQITNDIFGTTSEPWRNVELKFGNPAEEESTSDFRFGDDELEWLYPIVSNVESLSLRMEIGTKAGDFYPILKRLLNAPKKLRALAIEPIFLTARTRDIEDWKDTFENLQEFEVLKPPSGWQKDIDDWKTDEFHVDYTLFAFAFKMKNIRVLKHYYPEAFFAADDEESIFLARFESYMLPKLLSRIAFVSSNTLKHVTLPEQGFWNQEKPDLSSGFCSFPYLESATFSLPVIFQTQHVREYLLALPMLKELDFTMCTNLPSSILTAIGERSDRLRTLKIQTPDFDGTNWQFLKRTKIEEFLLEVIDSGEGKTLPDEALNCLPSTIQRLRLLGPLASNPIPALARLNPSLVTDLEFVDSGDNLTDDTIKYIRQNFKMLRLLNLTNAKRVTDAGFVASSESDSLSGIKGLKMLCLERCESITDATLGEIRFLELFDVELPSNVTEECTKKMLQNNPSLLARLEHQGLTLLQICQIR